MIISPVAISIFGWAVWVGAVYCPWNYSILLFPAYPDPWRMALNPPSTLTTAFQNTPHVYLLSSGLCALHVVVGIPISILSEHRFAGSSLDAELLGTYMFCLEIGMAISDSNGIHCTVAVNEYIIVV